MSYMRSSLLIVLFVAAIPASHGFSSAGVLPFSCSTRAARCPGSRSLAPALGLRMQVESKDKPAADVEKTVEKYGLEAGVFKALTSKDKSGPSAKDLLKKYGSAYLLTSISLSLVSFTVCYVLVDNGVDVAALLGKLGIEASATSEKVGTSAIAYAAHKAASPIRFPPTVALTPLTAKYLFRKEVDDDAADA